MPFKTELIYEGENGSKSVTINLTPDGLGIDEKDRGCNSKEMEYTQGQGWDNDTFDTYHMAVDYVHNWLGIYSPGIATLITRLNEGNKYDYSGMGDSVYIKEIE